MPAEERERHDKTSLVLWVGKKVLPWHLQVEASPDDGIYANKIQLIPSSLGSEWPFLALLFTD